MKGLFESVSDRRSATRGEPTLAEEFSECQGADLMADRKELGTIMGLGFSTLALVSANLFVSKLDTFTDNIGTVLGTGALAIISTELALEGFSIRRRASRRLQKLNS